MVSFASTESLVLRMTPRSIKLRRGVEVVGAIYSKLLTQFYVSL